MVVGLQTDPSDPYQQRLWQPNGYALLSSVFPHATRLTRQDIHRQYNIIRRDLRNRVFHHEAIWNRPNLQQEQRCPGSNPVDQSHT